MKGFCKWFGLGLLFVGLAGPPRVSLAQTPADCAASEVVALLEKQNQDLSRDLRRIQREIAALRADLDKPGLRDVFGGIGYILGLFGAAAFIAARRKE